jgi:hypothetical protein
VGSESGFFLNNLKNASTYYLISAEGKLMKAYTCLLGVLGAFCILLSPGTSRASAFTSLYAFGDSLTDVGNDYAVTFNTVPAPAIYTDGTNTGRFTNGLNYLDVLAGDLGLGPLTPSVSGGTVYAYGGAHQ